MTLSRNRILVVLLLLLGPSPLLAEDGLRPSSATSLDGEWRLATDPQNVGRQQAWYRAPRPEAKPAKVPWIIQDAFPGYHGVAWYWRDFAAPVNPHPGGRYLLRFWAVDYLADVWLNGVRVGGHEGGETPFVLDVTAAVKPGENNLLAVRVLNPGNEPIDGITLDQTARSFKVLPFRAGAFFDFGGITDSVELLCVPAVRVEDLFVIAHPGTAAGKVQIRATVVNASAKPGRGYVDFMLAEGRNGETLAASRRAREFPAGATRIDEELTVDHPQLWELGDPHLYRVTARAGADGTGSFDERSVRCGFRDFRFADGHFRLNGRRIYLRCSHTCNHYPVGLRLPEDPDLLRRDLLNMKVMGFNAVRFIEGGASRVQLDLCDEIGLLVYEEPQAASNRPIAPGPKMAERYDRGLTELVRRDRSHPSIVIWGMLNEVRDVPLFRHVLSLLPLVRSLDPSRVVMLDSACRDRVAGIGSLSNPGSAVWEDVIADVHYYRRVPHMAGTIGELRAMQGSQPLFLSEYGIGSAVDLWRATRHFEQRGTERLEDAEFMRDRLGRFLTDWKQWRLDEAFARPEDFFMQSLKKMAGQRTLGLNAIRSNPNIIGHSLTGAIDHVMCGEGLTTLFRELKPGTIDALYDAWAPLRWCLFAEPVHVYRGAKVHVEAVLANEDVLRPGDYPARFQIVGPGLTRILDRAITVTIPKREGRQEPPFARRYFAADVAVDGPTGSYRFLATFERGAAAAGGLAEFHVTDPAEMPAVKAEVVLWGEDPGLAAWLAGHGIRTRPYPPPPSARREVILAAAKPPAPGGAAAMAELTRRIAGGSTVVFLSPAVFTKTPLPAGPAAFTAQGQPAVWLPLARKGMVTPLRSYLYLQDEWAKRHPIFDGLPCGGLLDSPGYYRDIIPDAVFAGQDPPAEAVAGAINAACDYKSGLMIAVYKLGEGRVILNTFRIRENLGSHPAAERLLRNMLRYAQRDLEKLP